MVIPIVIPVPIRVSSLHTPPLTQVRDSRNTVWEFFLGLCREVRYFATPKKNAELTAKAMLKRAKRQLRSAVKYNRRHENENPNWRYGGNFSDQWIHAITRHNYKLRDRAFRLFVPMMEAHVLEQYGVAVQADMRIISEEYASWIAYNWDITVPQAPPSPKRRRFFQRK